jgi:hypothetical protein
MKSEQYHDDGAECMFSVSGKQVQITYCGRTHKLKLSLGMKHLLALVTHPDMPVSANQLDNLNDLRQANYKQFDSPDELKLRNLHPLGSYLPMPMADYQTIYSIKQRLRNIIEELSEMQEYCDYGRADDLITERDKLASYLREVYRPCGKQRNFPDAKGLIRKRVQKSLHRALQDIAKCEPDLASELSACLDYQGRFVFRPSYCEISVNGF